MSRIIPSFYPIALIRVDEDGVPIHDENGLCIRCQTFQRGMDVGLITRVKWIFTTTLVKLSISRKKNLIA